ncbi:MAG TPA: alginate export family protein [Candidatus Bathyarchaeia archaeon]|nr:alginate export family protein [Candidatus Bathyarchaeia archaeon]
MGFELEGAGQFGTVGSGNIGAGMFTAILGYNLPVKDPSPRVYLEFDYASGDQKPGGKVGTFNQLYPNGHSIHSTSELSSFRHVTIFRRYHPAPGIQPNRNVVASELKVPQVLSVYCEANFFTSLAQSLLPVFSS